MIAKQNVAKIQNVSVYAYWCVAACHSTTSGTTTRLPGLTTLGETPALEERTEGEGGL